MIGYIQGQSPSNFLPRLFSKFRPNYKSNTLSLWKIVFLFIIFHFQVKIMAFYSSSAYNNKYDVFLSFRGADVRQGFLSHLEKALLDKGLEAFVDNQLERGKDIEESLLEKIEQSHIAIVIFSQNYAHSKWCLEELMKIVECRQTTNQTVIPVFYGVDPSHVQHLTGDYEMAQLRANNSESLVGKWGNALKDTANLPGFASSSFSNESQLIEEIIKHVLETLDPLYPSDSARDHALVGIDSRVEKFMSLLDGPEDVSVVGIWGEPGIGKTTLARVTYNRIRSKFDHECFVRDVREKCEKLPTATIQNEVFKCFKISGSRLSRKKLLRKKVILVLDDVSNPSQVESIMSYKDYMGCGSRIIVTSRDKRLLKKLGAKIHEVEELNDHEALELFSLHAFHTRFPEVGYSELFERAVKCAQGLPFALKVLGRNMFQESVKEGEDELEKFRNEGLSDLKMETMQDIASCFRGKTDFDESLVEKWRNSLKDMASLPGLVSSNFNDSASNGGLLVGIDSSVEEVMSLLSGPEDVCVVGIWGEPGIGKTTLAQATFDQIRSPALSLEWHFGRTQHWETTPVFYRVDPSHAQHLSGNYAMAQL